MSLCFQYGFFVLFFGIIPASSESKAGVLTLQFTRPSQTSHIPQGMKKGEQQYQWQQPALLISVHREMVNGMKFAY